MRWRNPYNSYNPYRKKHYLRCRNPKDISPEDLEALEQVAAALTEFRKTESITAASQKGRTNFNTAKKWLIEAGLVEESKKKIKRKYSARKYTNKTKNDALQLYQKGVKCSEIARQLNVEHPATVRSWCIAAGLRKQKVGKKRKIYTKQQKAVVLELCKNTNLSYLDISKKTKIGNSTIRRWCEDADYRAKFKKTVSKKKPKVKFRVKYTQLQKIKALNFCADTNLTYQQIADKINLPFWKIRDWCVKAGIRKPGKRRKPKRKDSPRSSSSRSLHRQNPKDISPEDLEELEKRMRVIEHYQRTNNLVAATRAGYVGNRKARQWLVEAGLLEEEKKLTQSQKKQRVLDAYKEQSHVAGAAEIAHVSYYKAKQWLAEAGLLLTQERKKQRMIEAYLQDKHIARAASAGRISSSKAKQWLIEAGLYAEETLTEEQRRQLVIEFFHQTHKFVEAAKAGGVGQIKAKQWLIEEGLYPPKKRFLRRRNPKDISPEDLEELEKIATVRRIYRETNCNESETMRRLRAMGMSASRKTMGWVEDIQCIDPRIAEARRIYKETCSRSETMRRLRAMGMSAGKIAIKKWVEGIQCIDPRIAEARRIYKETNCNLRQTLHQLRAMGMSAGIKTIKKWVEGIQCIDPRIEAAQRIYQETNGNIDETIRQLRAMGRGAARETIKKWVKGMPRYLRRRNPKDISPEDLEKLETIYKAREMRSQGQSVKSIAEYYDVAWDTANSWIHDIDATVSRREQAREWRRSGMSITSIAKQLKASRRKVRPWISDIELPTDPRIETVRQMREQGYTLNEIVRETGVSFRVVKRWTVDIEPGQRIHSLQSQYERARELVKEGHSYQEISDIMQVPKTTAYRWAQPPTGKLRRRNPKDISPEDLEKLEEPVMETILYAFPMDRQPKGRDDIVLWGFYPGAFVIKMTHGKDAEIHKVRVTPFDGDEEDAPYWAWWNSEREEFRHVYYFKGMVKMCFPYPIKAYEEKGDGVLLPVNVETIEIVNG